MTKRSGTSIATTIIILFTIVLGLSLSLTASEQFRPYYLHDGQKQFLQLSSERIAIRLSEGVTIGQIESIINAEPAISSYWVETTLTMGEIVVCELVPGVSETDIRTLGQDLSTQAQIQRAYFSYSAGNDRLIPTDQLVIRFSQTIPRSKITGLISHYGTTIRKQLTWLNDAYILTLNSQVHNIIEIANRFGSEPEVIFCHPNFIRLIKPLTTTPDDIYFPEQWALANSGQGGGTVGADIDMSNAWDYARGSEKVVIAIIDEGVDTTHEDLASQIHSQYDALDGDDDQQPHPWDGHGTTCAGIATARPNNSIGIAGVAWNCSLMPVRIAHRPTPLPNTWVTTDEIVADGIATAVNRGADVLSFSWGMGASSETIHAAVSYAKTEGRAGLGCVIVGAVGNDDANSILYPAAWDEVFAVGATNEWDQRKSKTTLDGVTHWGSNYGPELDVVAPGVHLWTTDFAGNGGFNGVDGLYGDSAGDYYREFDGTSSATPHVAGLAALILSLDSSLTSDAVQDTIANSAEDEVGLVSEDLPGWDQFMGYGRVNAYEAVRNLSHTFYVGETILADTYWDSSYVYVISSDFTIPTGVTLTIEAGTVVKFDFVPTDSGIHQRPKLLVNGTLDLLGTETDPVVFTSMRDDQYGGDSNGDGDVTTPSAGDWGYMKINGSDNSIQYCLFRYSGVGWFDQSYISESSIYYYDKYSIWVANSAENININNCTIEHFAVTGGNETINARAIYWVADQSGSDSAMIFHNNIIDGQDGIYIRTLNGHRSITIEGNIFSELSGIGIQCVSTTAPLRILVNDIESGAIGIRCSDCANGLLIDGNIIMNHTQSGIELEFTNADIVNNTLSQAGIVSGIGTSIFLTHDCVALIQGNSITGYATGIKSESGIDSPPCDIDIIQNRISDNSAFGIYLGSTDIGVADGPIALINDNDIFRNDLYNLYLGKYQNPGLQIINAENNWWGFSDSSLIASSIYEQEDDADSPSADFTPFHSSPVLAVGPTLEVDNERIALGLFPDSAVTVDLVLRNIASAGLLTFLIEEGEGTSSPRTFGTNQMTSMTADLVWLDVTPEMGTVLPGDSVVIQLSFNSLSLPDSVYEGYLAIESNDTYAGPTLIALSLDVSHVFVLTPNGGEQYLSGETVTANWNTTNKSLIDSANVWLSFDGGESFPYQIASGLRDSSHFDWVVPYISSDSCKVRTEVFSMGGYLADDQTDSLFGIISGACCGRFTSGRTGNTDCDSEGKRNLADLTRLIDRIYVSKEALCCTAEGNINGDPEAKLNLADITRLIDHIYVSKNETSLCQ